MGGYIGLAFGLLKSSQSLHDGLLDNILRFPVSYFDVTPTGKMLDIISKDVDVTDVVLPYAMKSVIRTFLEVSSQDPCYKDHRTLSQRR